MNTPLSSSTPSDSRTVSCAELLEELRRSRIELAPVTSETDLLPLEGDRGQLAPERFELEVRETPVVVFVRKDRSRVSYPLDRRVMELLETSYGESLVERPELLATAPAAAEPADRAQDAAALRQDLWRDDLEVRKLRLLRDALLDADLRSTDATLEVLLDAVVALTGAERGAVFLMRDGEWKPRVVRQPDGERDAVLPTDVLKRARVKRSVFTLEDVTDDPELYRNTVEKLHIRSLLVAPWVRDGEVEAICYLDRRDDKTVGFEPVVIELFSQLAADLWRLLEAALDRERLRAEVDLGAPFGGFVTRDPATAKVISYLRRVAPTRARVVILGGSGTGKTLLARAIHEHGPAPDGPFVTVRLPEITETLFQSELFGVEKGAVSDVPYRDGLLKEADGGTLFLDEIGHLSLEMQSKLLGVLDSEPAEYRSVGNGFRRSHFRLVVATSVDLQGKVEKGEFLPDLWYRISGGCKAAIPALGDRPDDVRWFARRYLPEAAELFDLPHSPEIDPQALDLLAGHDWPGGLRELKSVVYEAFGKALQRDDQRPAMRADDVALPRRGQPPPRHSAYRLALAATGLEPVEPGLDAELECLQLWRIIRALKQCDLNKSKAAKEKLGMPVQTLFSRLRSLGLEVKAGRLVLDNPTVRVVNQDLLQF